MFTWRNRRLSSPPQINSSVRPWFRPSVSPSFVCTCLHIRYSAENSTGPTDAVNYSSKSWIHVNQESEILRNNNMKLTIIAKIRETCTRFLQPTRSECIPNKIVLFTRITSASNNVLFLYLRRIYLFGEEGVNLILIPAIFFCLKILSYITQKRVGFSSFSSFLKLRSLRLTQVLVSLR